MLNDEWDYSAFSIQHSAFHIQHFHSLLRSILSVRKLGEPTILFLERA